MLREAKLIAAREGTTLKALVEEGLRHVVDERQQHETGFRLRDVRYGDSVGAPGHVELLSRMAIGGRAAGAKIHDARIAAICLDHSVSELWTADRDFSRFPDLKTRNPFVG